MVTVPIPGDEDAGGDDAGGDGGVMTPVEEDQDDDEGFSYRCRPNKNPPPMPTPSAQKDMTPQVRSRPGTLDDSAHDEVKVRRWRGLIGGLIGRRTKEELRARLMPLRNIVVVRRRRRGRCQVDESKFNTV